MAEDTKKDALLAFDRLLQIMDDLREKCPWDQKQTLESLRKLTIEETYELADAITENNLEEIKKELGDLFLHLVFYAKIGEEKGAFDVSSVLHGICEKLIFRHPHVYGDVRVENEDDVKRNWENLKLKEGKKSVLEGVPKSLPAMTKACRIQEKARGVGFDWDNKEQVWEKLQEELEELREEVVSDNKEKMEQELGDVLFSVINYARFLDLDPENALEKTNKKFIYRFQHMEKRVTEQEKNMSDLSLEELDIYWNEAKNE